LSDCPGTNNPFVQLITGYHNRRHPHDHRLCYFVSRRPPSPQVWLASCFQMCSSGPTASTLCSWAHSSRGVRLLPAETKTAPPLPALTEADPRHNTTHLRIRMENPHPHSRDPHSVCLPGAAHLTAASGRIPLHSTRLTSHHPATSLSSCKQPGGATHDLGTTMRPSTYTTLDVVQVQSNYACKEASTATEPVISVVPGTRKHEDYLVSPEYRCRSFLSLTAGWPSHKHHSNTESWGRSLNLL
jgi:hypothetical protein